jgi:hypothetical protein
MEETYGRTATSYYMFIVALYALHLISDDALRMARRSAYRVTHSK